MHLLFLPVAFVVFLVCKDISDPELVVGEIRYRYQTIVIAFDVEDNSALDPIGCIEGLFHFGEVFPISFLNSQPPIFQGRFGFGVFLKELPGSPPLDDLHSIPLCTNIPKSGNEMQSKFPKREDLMIKKQRSAEQRFCPAYTDLRFSVYFPKQARSA